MPNAVSVLRVPSRHVLAFLLPLALGLTACGGGGDCVDDPTTAAPLGTPSTPFTTSTPPAPDDPQSRYFGQWVGPCIELVTEVFVTIPGRIYWIGEVMVQEPDTIISQWVPSGRSERIGMEIVPTSPGVLTMYSTKRVFGTPTCSGAPEEIQQSIASEATFMGVKYVHPQDADMFEIRNAEGTKKLLMLAKDDQLFEGDNSFGSDSEGYQYTMKGAPSFTREPATP
jgi:hypothetical protein